MACSSVFKPIFDILSPTTHRDTIATPLVEAVSGPLRQSLSTFPYAVPPSHRQFLCDAGININDYGTKSHPHPVHKTIELHLLRNVWRNYASSPSSILFMKPSKFEKLKDLNPNFKELLNYRLTPKDTTRYPETSPHLPTTPTVFMHDALMYYSQAQILDLFIRCPNLENLYASLVVPPESDFTHLSLNPTLYRFQFSEDELIYHLENNPAHSYTQPRSAISWLKTSVISGQNVQLSVTILDSWGPVHSLLIQRGLAPLTNPLDKVSFKVPDAILLPEANSIRQDPRHRLVPRAAFNLLFSYVRSVRTLRVTDPSGLIRTQSNKPEYNWVTSAAWDNLQHFALHTSPHRPISHYMLFKSPLQRLKHWARTNEFFLFAITAFTAAPTCSSLSALALHLSRCRVSHLRLFAKDLITPPKPLFPSFNVFSAPPTPRFVLKFTPRQTPFISHHFNSWFKASSIPDWSNMPGPLRRWYISHVPKSLPSWSKYVILASALIPLSVLAYRWFTGPDTPQSLHDQYQAYFHPDPWALTFDRKPCYTDPKNFLPFDPTPRPKPLDAPDHPLTPKVNLESLSAGSPPPPPPSSPSPPSNPPAEPKPTKDNKQSKKKTHSTQHHVSFEVPIFSTDSLSPQPTHNQAEVAHPDPPVAPSDPQPEPPLQFEDISNTEPESTFDPATLEQIFTPGTAPADYSPPRFEDPSPISIDPGSRSRTDPIFYDPDLRKHDLSCDCDYHAGEAEPLPAFDFSSSDPNSIHSLDTDVDEEPQIPDPAPPSQSSAPAPNPRVSFAPVHPDTPPKAHMLVFCESMGVYIQFTTQNLSHLFAEEATEIGLPDVSLHPRPAGFAPKPSNLARVLVFSSKFDSYIALTPENFTHLTESEIANLSAPSSSSSSSKPQQEPEAEAANISAANSEEASPTTSPDTPDTSSLLEPQSPHSTASIDSFGVLDYVETDPPTPFQPDDNSLMSDPTAMGEAKAWELLHPKEFDAFSGAFVTRARNGPPANFPYPPTDCLLQALSQALSIQPQAFWQTICSELPDRTIDYPTILQKGLNTEHLTVLATMYDFHCTVTTDRNSEQRYGLTNSKTRINIEHTSGNPGHFSFSSGPVQPLSGAKTSDLAHAALRFRTSHGELLPILKVHNYTTHLSRAKNLISNMKNGFDGVLINVNPHEPNKAREAFLTLDQSIDQARPKRVQLIHLAGFAGCGKSYPVQKLLQTPIFKHHKVAVPTTELRSEWKDAMQVKPKDNWRISTWESSLLKSAKILVIDEVYRMPRGYLDLAIHADSNLEFVIILGDPIQGEYHSTHQSSSNHRLSSEIAHLSPFIDFYCLWSRRIPQDVAHFFQIQSLNPEPGFHSFTNRFPNTQILANSTATASLLQQAGYPAITIASSQGSTYTCPATINLDKHSRILSLQHSVIAITRSKRGNIFVGDRSVLKQDSSSNPIFAKYFHDEQIDLFDTFRSILPKLNILRQPLKSRTIKLDGALTSPPLSAVFSQDHVFSQSKHTPPPPDHSPSLLSLFTSRSANDTSDVIFFAPAFFGNGETNSPQISTHFLPETRRPLHFDFSSCAVSDPKPSLNLIPTQITSSPIYPGENFETLAAQFMPAHDAELREILWQDQSSNQFPYLTNSFSLSSQPLSLLAPVHSPKNDHTLLPASIEKRLRFRATPSPYIISPKDQILGTILFSSLCRAYNRDPDISIPFDENLFLECINVNEYCQLSSKTQSVIMANAYRSDPDWRWSAVRIFAKSQHKVNESTLMSDWKACQTLALMHDAVILILGPVKKYQRIFDNQDRPPHIYVHASHTPNDLAHWAQSHLTHSQHIANDYTAFDQSQHGEAVVLEVLKMRRLNIPETLIDLHLTLKTNVETQFGPLTCMRLTGEPGTYDDNTDYNLAVLFSEYNITNQGTAVSGDDSLLDSEPPTRPEWGFIRPLLALRFKKEFTRYGLFCGYYIGPEGACRSPLALFAKLAIALDDGSISDKLTSYLAEFLIGHSLGQPVWNLIAIEHVIFLAANFDFFCRHTPTSLKTALNLGEPSSSIIDLLFPTIRFLTYPLWSLLNNGQRALYHRSKLGKNFSSILPFSSHSEGELLPSFNLDDSTSDSIDSLSAKSDPEELIHDLTDFHTQIDQPYYRKLNSDKEFSVLLSGAGQMAISADIIAQVIKLLSGLSHAEEDGQRDPQSLLAPPALPSPAPLSSPSRSLTTPASSSSAGITLAFQSLYYDITGTETKSASQSIAALPAITALLPNYRHARLTKLEAIISPTASSQKYPQTIEVVWCTADQTIADDKIMQTYGSARYAFGGPINMPVLTSHPADLAQLNPVIKDSITYADTPRFCIRFWQNADCQRLGTSAPICGSIFFRGLVHLSSPSASPSSK